MTTLVVRPDRAHGNHSLRPHWLPPSSAVALLDRCFPTDLKIHPTHSNRQAPRCAGHSYCRSAAVAEVPFTTASRRSRGRRGTTAVEVAVVLPVFFVFVWGLIEFAHAYMVVNLLNAAAKRAAREGVVDDVTTSQIVARVNEIVGSAIDTQHLTVHIKDASVFDQASVDADGIDYAALPNVELDDLEPRQLFVVYLEVPYNDVAIMPPRWVTSVTLKGQSVQRHE
jgi:hypothetical protein